MQLCWSMLVTCVHQPQSAGSVAAAAAAAAAVVGAAIVESASCEWVCCGLMGAQLQPLRARCVCCTTCCISPPLPRNFVHQSHHPSQHSLYYSDYTYTHIHARRLTCQMKADEGIEAQGGLMFTLVCVWSCVWRGIQKLIETNIDHPLFFYFGRHSSGEADGK